MSQPERVFLTAEWRDLVMLNYAVEPNLLHHYVPPGTSLDSFQGKTYVSLVGFRFCKTKLLSRLPIPFHSNFDEVNLRLYVRRKEGSDHRRGVVFIAEVVPRRAIAAIARIVYGENYKYLPMRHQIASNELSRKMSYEWKIGNRWCSIKVETLGPPAHPREGSLEQFITEHYWGYSKGQSAGCLQYRVSHVPWQVWAAAKAGFEGDAASLYGRELGAVLQRPPDSAFVADGSPVSVFKGSSVQ